MCNVIETLSAIKPYISGRLLSQVFSPEVLGRYPYRAFIKGHCLGCGRRMYDEEMFPENRTPRAMCQACYDEWTKTDTHYCEICGDFLGESKILKQREEPKEVSHRLHDGQCMDYFSVISAKVLGEDMSFLRDNSADEVELLGSAQPLYALPSQRHILKELSFPIPALDYQPMEHLDFSSVEPTYKGKKIKVLRNHR